MTATDHRAQYLRVKFGDAQRPRAGAYVVCETCGREFYVSPSRLKRKHKVRFCSMICYDKRGDKNPFWGKQHQGETKIKWIGHPGRIEAGKKLAVIIRAKHAFVIGVHKKSAFIEEAGKCNRCGMNDKRILLLHHIDRNRKHTHRENLEVLCPNCHAIEHYEHGDGMFSNFTRRLKRTHCKRGHEYTEENTAWVLNSLGRLSRICKQCQRDRRRERQLAQCA